MRHRRPEATVIMTISFIACLLLVSLPRASSSPQPTYNNHQNSSPKLVHYWSYVNHAQTNRPVSRHVDRTPAAGPSSTPAPIKEVVFRYSMDRDGKVVVHHAPREFAYILPNNVSVYGNVSVSRTWRRGQSGQEVSTDRTWGNHRGDMPPQVNKGNTWPTLPPVESLGPTKSSSTVIPPTAPPTVQSDLEQRLRVEQDRERWYRDQLRLRQMSVLQEHHSRREQQRFESSYTQVPSTVKGEPVTESTKGVTQATKGPPMPPPTTKAGFPTPRPTEKAGYPVPPPTTKAAPPPITTSTMRPPTTSNKGETRPLPSVTQSEVAQVDPHLRHYNSQRHRLRLEHQRRMTELRRRASLSQQTSADSSHGGSQDDEAAATIREANNERLAAQRRHRANMVQSMIRATQQRESRRHSATATTTTTSTSTSRATTTTSTGRVDARAHVGAAAAAETRHFNEANEVESRNERWPNEGDLRLVGGRHEREVRVWMDNLECDGTETTLAECRFNGWGLSNCGPQEAAGVICEYDITTTTSTSPSTAYSRFSGKAHIRDWSYGGLQVRLMNGRIETEGRVEVRHGNGNWSLVCGDGWGLLQAGVICRQLGMGFAADASQTSFFGGNSEDIELSGVECRGNEARLDDCTHDRFGDVFCPGTGDNIATVNCASELADLVPDPAEVIRTTHLEDRQMWYLQCALEENCLASRAYEIQKTNEAGWHLESRRLLRFTAKIVNQGTAEFRPFLPKNAWQWHQCHLHYHSMEVFAHFDLLDPRTNRKIAEGHKASFCLEDNDCLEGVEKTFNCQNFGDQGITVGCADIYAHSVDCQWIDVTEVPVGNYIFKVSINPEFKVGEQTFENNAAVCNLTLTETYAHVSHCVLGRP
ncbi:unnamed protein product [Notodromas monacha]|uniref:protein-lysine 6-oxidase n=1 Tax=Notodromas monacha TaxID=399045 RepID=A0A7R9BIA4_9CRUS|nr:unnamed protein product [Notodromas monacha]CAG0916011.1 unnamed protein product [Notodromas monacha]